MPTQPALHTTQTSKEPTQLEEDASRVHPGGHNRSHHNHKYVPQPPDTCRRTPYQGNGSQPTPSAQETWLMCTLTATPIPQLQQPSTPHRTSVPRGYPRWHHGHTTIVTRCFTASPHIAGNQNCSTRRFQGKTIYTLLCHPRHVRHLIPVCIQVTLTLNL